MNKAIKKIMKEIPPGTRMRLQDDYPETVHEVSGYTVDDTGAYIRFADGRMLNIARRKLITEIL